jgi:carbon storage regulator CsrA
MLVLTRKTTEKIQIGDSIVVTILRVKGQTVRVGIDAPREVRVIRSELPAENDMTVLPDERHAAPLRLHVAALQAG